MLEALLDRSVLWNFFFSSALKHLVAFPDIWQSDFYILWNAKSHSPWLRTESSNIPGGKTFLGWEISVNSAVQVLTGRITQDCTGEGLFITTHQTCLSALYPQGKCEILLFSPSTLFQGDTTLEQQSKNKPCLGGEKNCIDFENGGEQSPEEQTADLRKIANAFSPNAYTDTKQSNKNEIVQLIKSIRPDWLEPFPDGRGEFLITSEWLLTNMYQHLSSLGKLFNLSPNHLSNSRVAVYLVSVCFSNLSMFFQSLKDSFLVCLDFPMFPLSLLIVYLQFSHSRGICS